MEFDGDWSIFDDWLRDGAPKGTWLLQWESGELIQEQVDVVERNAELVQDREKFKRRIAHFERALATIKSDRERKEKRKKYCIHLDHYQFENLIDLSYLSIPCSISFRRVIFNEDCYLKYAEVEGDVELDHAEVGNTVEIDGTKVKGYISLIDAEIKGYILLNNATIEGDVSLINLILIPETELYATGMVVEGSLFVSSAFYSEVIFRRLKVGQTARFYGSSFKQTPNFRDALFARPPEVADMTVEKPTLASPKKTVLKYLWQRIKYFSRGRAKPRGQKQGIFPLFKICKDKAEVAKYRKLKAMAIAANDHEKDGEFFSYEMMAKRGVETTGFFELLANSFYNWLSGYGQSWTKPVCWMIGSWFVFLMIYLWYAWGILQKGWFCFAALYSALNTIPFLSTLHRLAPWPDKYVDFLEGSLQTLADKCVNLNWLFAIAMVQQLIGIVLLFFLLLGLRNRFRLKLWVNLAHPPFGPFSPKEREGRRGNALK